MEGVEKMREALLNKTDKTVIAKVRTAQKNPSDDEFPESTLYRRFRDVEEVQVSRFCATPETRRLLYINPAIYSQYSGLGLFAFLDQFLKLWPTFRRSALPYLSIPAVGSGFVGFGMGVHSTYHVNDEQSNPFKRVWFSVLGGIIVFPFLLGEEIEVYCSYPSHLDAERNCMVSETTFWETFFPAPAVLGLGYMIWKMIPLLQKHAWMSRSKSSKLLVIAVDSLADVLYYSRIFQTLLSNISKIPQPLAYELGAIPAAVIVLGGQTLMPQHKEKFRIVITVGMTINLMFYMANFLKAEFIFAQEAEKNPYSWSFLLKSIGFPLLFGMGTAFAIWHSRQKVIEQRKTEQWIPAGTPRLLLQQQLDEALTRPEVIQTLAKRLLADPQLKQMLVQDELIKRLLLEDENVRGSLQEKALSDMGFTDVVLGTMPVTHAEDASYDEAQGDRKESQESVASKKNTGTPTAGPPILHEFSRQVFATSSGGAGSRIEEGQSSTFTPVTPKKGRSWCRVS